MNFAKRVKMNIIINIYPHNSLLNSDFWKQICTVYPIKQSLHGEQCLLLVFYYSHEATHRLPVNTHEF